MADVETPTSFIALCLAAERADGHVGLVAKFEHGEPLRRKYSMVVEVRLPKHKIPFTRSFRTIDQLGEGSRALLMDLAERKFL
jgi:hypothetical protein